jgi:hypothetical protein
VNQRLESRSSGIQKTYKDDNTFQFSTQPDRLPDPGSEPLTAAGRSAGQAIATGGFGRENNNTLL